jgi:hypothetical protein
MLMRRFTSIQTAAIASLILITTLVGTALVCFVVNDSSATKAAQELLAFKQHAQQEAQKRRNGPGSPSEHIIVSMVPLTISQSDQAQIDSLKQRYESLVYRRVLAHGLFTRGMGVAVVVVGFCWVVLAKPKPKQ